MHQVILSIAASALMMHQPAVLFLVQVALQQSVQLAKHAFHTQPALWRIQRLSSAAATFMRRTPLAQTVAQLASPLTVPVGCPALLIQNAWATSLNQTNQTRLLLNHFPCMTAVSGQGIAGQGIAGQRMKFLCMILLASQGMKSHHTTLLNNHITVESHLRMHLPNVSCRARGKHQMTALLVWNVMDTRHALALSLAATFAVLVLMTHRTDALIDAAVDLLLSAQMVKLVMHTPPAPWLLMQPLTVLVMMS
mmetsp:Transcript_29708/g.62555  ORF Transcript_29708/g.62555 Transcript_29708/m.62555 type:complete len:251 (+) Transcript_29708:665-1417(+)